MDETPYLANFRKERMSIATLTIATIADLYGVEFANGYTEPKFYDDPGEILVYCATQEHLNILQAERAHFELQDMK